MLRFIRLTGVVGIAIVTLTACVYRMDIAQGNRIDPALIDQLEIGMSRKQVEFLLGSPAVVDLYQPDRWHYVFFYKTGSDGSIVQSHMTLTFSNDLLSSVEGVLNPG